jgi:hypothetical protein
MYCVRRITVFARVLTLILQSWIIKYLFILHQFNVGMNGESRRHRACQNMVLPSIIYIPFSIVMIQSLSKHHNSRRGFRTATHGQQSSESGNCEHR